MKTLVVKDEMGFDNLVTVCKTFTDQDDYPLDVTIKKHTTAIVDAQKGLYWRWIGFISKSTGNTKEELHTHFKETIFLNIYIADMDNHPTFNQQLVDAMRLIKHQAPGEYKTLRESVIHGVSHLDATKENWHDVFVEVSRVANGLNVKLPVSDRKGVQK